MIQDPKSGFLPRIRILTTANRYFRTNNLSPVKHGQIERSEVGIEVLIDQLLVDTEVVGVRC